MVEPHRSTLAVTGKQASDETELFPTTLPPWVTRSLGWCLVLVFVAAFLFAVLVRVPESIRCAFVLVPANGKLLAELYVPEEAMAEVRPGLPVRLLFNAFPYQRYGVRSGTIVGVNPTITGTPEGQIFQAKAQPVDQSISAGGVTHPFRAGMRGEARIIMGHRTLIDYVFEPIRRLKESVGG